ncbi:hypothetical protein GCM10010276_27410 [Streptomyces longisporus]|uniref:Uncharacterized protein n=1 Tax=Streptomyces longisporus TaxID=1948 RepID=A0ABN3LSN7_STRLO
MTAVSEAVSARVVVAARVARLASCFMEMLHFRKSTKNESVDWPYEPAVDQVASPRQSLSSREPNDPEAGVTWRGSGLRHAEGTAQGTAGAWPSMSTTDPVRNRS